VWLCEGAIRQVFVKKLFSKKEAIGLGLGLGVGALGALTLAIRNGFRRAKYGPVPDYVSPAIFSTLVQPTSAGEVIYHTSGKGVPLIFVHGVTPGGSSYEWSRVYPGFAESREVLAVDLIGFGESERPPRVLTADDHARGISDFLRAACHGRQAVVVASGLSAGFCLLMASQHPELTRQLILFLPDAVLQNPGKSVRRPFAPVRKLPFLRQFVYRNCFARKPFLRTWLAKNAFENPEDADEDVVNAYAAFAQQSGAEHAIHGLLAGTYDLDLAGRLPSVQQPVTFLLSSKAEEAAEPILSLLPRRSVVNVPDGSLLAPLAHPGVFVDAIRTALDGDLSNESVA